MKRCNEWCVDLSVNDIDYRSLEYVKGNYEDGHSPNTGIKYIIKGYFK